MFGLNPKNEWMVCPPTFTAATPVGAITAMRFFDVFLKWPNNVDFPVPALPVTKMFLREFSIISMALENVPLNSSISIINPDYFCPDAFTFIIAFQWIINGLKLMSTKSIYVII